MASKFFPYTGDSSDPTPLCEKDYFRRLDLLCFECGEALRGNYVTALNRKYHLEHFWCKVCHKVLSCEDSCYYEHDDNIYCKLHYVTKFANWCNGCETPILKQFVEIFRDGSNQLWHPECCT